MRSRAFIIVAVLLAVGVGNTLDLPDWATCAAVPVIFLGLAFLAAQRR